MTKPLIKLPGIELREAKEALNRIYAEITDNKAEIAAKDAEIIRLKEMLHVKGSLVPQG